MSIQAGTTPIDMEPVSVPSIADPAIGQTILDRVVRTMFGRPTARFAIVWIGILAALAVLAPLLANSHPILLVANGRLSSPMLMSLDYVDWTLIFAAIALVVLARLRSVRLRDKVWVFAVSLVLVGGIARFTRPGLLNIDYSRFRTLSTAGKVRFVLNAPVPYSASDRLIDELNVNDRPPSHHHWMGTEDNGGDVFSRLLHACRTAMSIGLISTGIAITIGIVIGGLMGYFAGWVDLLGMRVIEMFEAIPTLILLITLVAFFPGESYRLPMLMAAIGAFGWTGYARYLRAEFLKLRNMDFVHAAVASGLPTRTIVFRHILPNGITPVVIAASFSIAGAIVTESTLSFLGLGTIDQPSWGGMLTQSLGEGGEFHWWLAFFPGVAIFITVFAYNLLGEALADALDPKRL